MSEFGQLTEAPRVSPAQGSMAGFFAAGQQQDQMLEEQSKQILLEMTRQFLGNQMGLPQGVDPMAVQQFQGEQQGQKIRKNIDQRAKQDHQNKYDFANKFIGGLPQQSDPTLGAIQRAGGPQGAEALLNILGNQYGRRGELDNRSAINNADNAAAQTRLETEIRLKQEAAVAEQQKQTGVDTVKEERLRQALVKGQTTGDWTDFYSMAPNAVGMPTQYDREQTTQGSAAARAAAQKETADKEMLRKQLSSQSATPADKEQQLPPQIPNQYFDPRVMTPRREGDGVLQNQYDNVKNFINFIPKTVYYGAQDAGYKGAELIDQLLRNFRF